MKRFSQLVGHHMDKHSADFGDFYKRENRQWVSNDAISCEQQTDFKSQTPSLELQKGKIEDCEKRTRFYMHFYCDAKLI